MAPDSEARCDLAPHGFDSCFGNGGAGDEPLLGDLELFGDSGLALGELVVRELVALGQKDAFVDSGSGGPVMHLTILRAGGSSHVQKDEDQPQSVGALEIAAHELTPRAGDVLRNFRVSVTGEVDDVEAFVDEIELNGLGFSGRLAHARDCLAFQNGIDEARLADVRATDHCELRSAVSRKVLGLIRRAVELDCSDVHLMFIQGNAKAEVLRRGTCEWFGRLTTEIVQVFSAAGQGMVTMSM